MTRKKIKNAEILSAIVFPPPSENGFLNFIRNSLKNIFRLSGKILSIFI
jgi:hypothetical protein